VALPDPLMRLVNEARELGGGKDKSGDLATVTAPDFVKGLVAPRSVVRGILRSGYLHSLSAPPNHGKTSIGLTIGAHVAIGRDLAGVKVAQEKVLYLAGENPDDVRARLVATCRHFSIDPEQLRDRFEIHAGAFPLRDRLPDIINMSAKKGPFGLAVTDTSAAFYSGEDENSNVEARAHGQDLRVLTQINGQPAVVTMSHTIKNAGRDDLVPRGGSAFLAEIDTNLCCWLEGETVTLHWQRKIRGPAFQPMCFQLRSVVLEGIVDQWGDPLPSVVAVPITEKEAEAHKRKQWENENLLVYVMAESPKGSVRDWARSCSWLDERGEPQGWRVSRLLKSLADKALTNPPLVRKTRGDRWALTEAGKTEAGRK